MSVGHWIVIAADWVMASFAFVGAIQMFREKEEGIGFSLILMVLMLLNIAAICVR